jgi:hypothetical protein
MRAGSGRRLGCILDLILSMERSSMNGTAAKFEI